MVKFAKLLQRSLTPSNFLPIFIQNTVLEIGVSEKLDSYSFTDFKTRAGNDQSNMTYLVCNCIKKCNDTWKATANSNTNDARKCNTENNKENIKTQEDYT